MAARKPRTAPTSAARRMRGFEHGAALIAPHLRAAGEKRGFAVARLLTHWAEIVGQDIAAMAQPAKVGYGREGFGATLTLLVAGAQAPLVQADSARIRERVNACYGYNAISRIRITQTAPQGFAEARAAFATPPRPAAPAPAIAAAARASTAGIADENLRSALETLAANILSRQKSRSRRET